MDPVQEYIESFLAFDNQRLPAIDADHDRLEVQPSVGPEVGKLLGLLVRATGARRVLELGSALGYSAVWLAEALRVTGGTLVSIEQDEARFREASRNIEAAGCAGIVRLVRGDAEEELERLEGSFDLILQDSAKPLYPKLLERCVALTRPGGLIVADDALFKPRGVAERFSAPVHQYNERAFAHPLLYSTILPVGDGVTISVKLAGPRTGCYP